jgi:heme-degrading monooxygenase HmoA
MYATIRNYSGNKQLADALVENENAVAEVISAIGGFRAYSLVRTDDGDAVSVSVFDDRPGAEESTRAAGDWIRQNLAGMSVSAPQVTSGDVVITF